MVNLLVENLVDLPRPFGSILPLVGILLVFSLFGLAGLQGGRRTGQTGMGSLAGFWCALVSMLILFLFAFFLGFAFMPRMEQILAGDLDYQRSNLKDLKAYSIWNILDSGFSHAFLSPIFGAGFGALGGLAGKWLFQSRNK